MSTEKRDALEKIREQLGNVEAALIDAETAHDVDQIVALEAKRTVLERHEQTLVPEADAETMDEATDLARNRLKKIPQALASYAASYLDDAERVRLALNQYRAAVERMNDRYRAMNLAHTEAAALCDRFGFDFEAVKASLPGNPEPPASMYRAVDVPELSAVGRFVAPVTEEREEWKHRRRTYAEIDGTRGKEIIDMVGPKPWPAITEAMLARKAAEETEKADVMMAWAEQVPDAIAASINRMGGA